jgi:hypothetical protein
MNNVILTEEDAKKKLTSVLKSTLQAVNDIDIVEGVSSFVKKGGYIMKDSFKKNLESCIQYLAIKKAHNK